MSKVLTVVSTGEGNLYVEETKIAGAQRFRWRCFCREREAWTVRKSSKDIWTTFEALRQHWADVHPILCENILINWYEVHKQVPWLLDQNVRDDDGRFWVAPSGKRPAVAEDYYAAKKEAFAQLYGAKATVRIINLNTGATSMVTGASFSFDATLAEEKKGMSRLSDIEARLRELEKEAARYARFPKADEWPIGTVIKYTWTSPNSDGEAYTYAVLKANSEWYWTGAWRQGIKHGNYDVLIEALADDNVSDIRVATPEDFDPLFPELTDLMSAEDAAKVEDFLANPETGVKAERPASREGGIFVPVVKGSEK